VSNSKKKSSKKNTTSKNTPKTIDNNHIYQELSTEDMNEVLQSIKEYIIKFRNEGGRGALISNNLEHETKNTPFQILKSCIISLRTRDEVTERISEKLFAKVSTPKEFTHLTEEELAQLIYPTAFYTNKAKQILELCSRLVKDFDSKVPDELETLLSFRGVGRKTANLVVTLGFNKPGICVDTHVARITQRMGYVSFKKIDKENKIVFRSADEVEMILRKKLPKEWWIPINDLLVTYGQTICAPISPKCSQCVIEAKCMKIGITKFR
jgi:endonuclease-3